MTISDKVAADLASPATKLDVLKSRMLIMTVMTGLAAALSRCLPGQDLAAQLEGAARELPFPIPDEIKQFVDLQQIATLVGALARSVRDSQNSDKPPIPS